MADVKSFRNRLKLKQEAARKLAVLDLERVEESDREQAVEVLLGHLPAETSREIRCKIIELLVEWKGKAIEGPMREMSVAGDAALATDLGAALEYLSSLP